MSSRRFLSQIAAALLISLPGIQIVGAQQAELAANVRFAAIDIFVDSAEPLAAWQFELTDAAGSMTVVGVENGDSEAFADAPYYDLEAVNEDRADRIIVADFSLADPAELPLGRTRIATVHVRLTGSSEPELDLNLIAAGNADGEPITAAANLEYANGSAL